MLGSEVAMLPLKVFVAVRLRLSVRVSVAKYGPTVVGVPAKVTEAPVVEFKPIPAGVPVTLQMYGDVPSVTEHSELYAIPTCVGPSDGLHAMLGGGVADAIMPAKVCVAACSLESVTRTVMR